MIRIGIVAPSSVIPKIEFELGVGFLERQGYSVEIHPSVYGEHFFYPARDEQRAEALIEFAARDDLDALWCARGGYGATHLLPYLDHAKVRLKRKKKKTLLGYSDATALLEWFRVNLGWQTIHAPMPSLRTFSLLKPAEWEGLTSLLSQATGSKKKSIASHSLTAVYLPKGFKEVEAPLVGGNLFVWNSLLGTKNAGSAKRKILFLEEIQENLGRMNRMLHHLEQAGGLKETRAIVLGDFLDCPDSVPLCLSEGPEATSDLEAYLRHPPNDKMVPLRKIYSTEAGLDYIFKDLGKRLEIAVFKGVPAGHGPHFHSLYLGKKHRLQRNGKLSLI